MKHLVGRLFSIADGEYRIVDVQRLGADALVYAERQPAPRGAAPAAAPGEPAPGPRAAFHYNDIAALLEQGAGAC